MVTPQVTTSVGLTEESLTRLRRVIHREVTRIHSEGCETKIAMLEDDLEKTRADLDLILNYVRAEWGDFGIEARIDAVFLGPTYREARAVVDRHRQA